MSAANTLVAYVPRPDGRGLDQKTMPWPTLQGDDVLLAVSSSVFGVPEQRMIREGRQVTPGGAALGRIVATGPAAATSLGAWALCGPLLATEESESTRRGFPGGCPKSERLGLDTDGTLASHVRSRLRWVVLLTGALAEVPPLSELAALPREATLAYDMIARAHLAPGEGAIWFGDNATSQLGLAMSLAQGARAIAAQPEDAVSRLRAQLDALEVRNPVWKVFETSGRPAHRRAALAACPYGATCVLAAGESIGQPIDDQVALTGLERALTIQSVPLPHPDLVAEVVARWAKGELDLAGVVQVIGVSDLPRFLAEDAAQMSKGPLCVVRMTGDGVTA